MLQEIQSIFKLSLTIYLIYHLGLILGTITTMTLFYLYKLMMKLLFGLEMLSPIDKCFVGRCQRERLNIVALIKFDNFNAHKLLNLFIEKGLKKVPKFRKRVIYTLGNYYWKEVNMTECEERIKIVNDVTITNDEEAMALAQQEFNIQIDTLNEPPYEVKIIPYDDQENKGVVMWKFDHCFSDGLGMVSFICALADNYSPEVFPSIMKNYKFSLWREVLDYLSFVIYGPICVYYMFKNNNLTPLRANTNTSGISKCLISKSFDLDNFKVIRKELKISFNDLMLSVLSKVIKRICDHPRYKGAYDSLSTFKLMMPVGRREIPDKIENVQINNEAYSVSLTLPLISNVRSDNHMIKKTLHETLKNSGYVQAMSLFASLALYYLPESIQFPLMDSFTKKTDITFSNLPCAVSPLYYAGCKLDSIILLVSTQRLGIFMPLYSFNKKFRFSVSVDMESGVDNSEIINYFEKELESLAH